MRSFTSRRVTSIYSMPNLARRNNVNIEVTGDLPWARPQFKKVVSMIRSSTLSPTGVRAAFEARGEIFSVPTEKGDYRNLTQSPGRMIAVRHGRPMARNSPGFQTPAENIN